MSKKKKQALIESEKNLTPEQRAANAKRRQKRSRAKKIVAICLALALCATGLGIGLMFIPKEGFIVNEDYASVSYEVMPGETYSPDKGYKALDVFGRLNWTFQHKDEWYSSYQGYVYTTVNQDVKTFKQFKDGRLISADISTSSLVNVAREFCYIPSADRVIWRESTGGPATYNGFDTPWETGEPRGNMTISGPDGFKAKNGLPATELVGYIFRDETVLSAEPAVDNGDGTYTIQYHMNPEVWQTAEGATEGAAAYYANQMKFTGGLTDVPSFNTIDIAFTFNENWENLKTEIHEDYVATMGFTVGCKADGVTVFSYNTPYLPLSDAYSEYFEQYAQMEATGAPEPTIDGMSALASAFAPVISGPSTLSLDLEVGGKPIEGIIYVDLHSEGVPELGTPEEIASFIENLEVRAKLGNVSLWVEGGEAYLSVADMKAKLTLSELTSLLSGLVGGAAGTEPVALAETEENNILSDLMNGAFTYERGTGKANMHSVLSLGEVGDLGELVLPIDFNYFIDEETLAVSLDNVKTNFTLADLSLGAKLAYSDAEPPAVLTDKEAYTELADCVKDIVALAASDVLHLDISYENEELGLTLTGGADLSLDDLTARASLELAVDGKSKQLDLVYSGMLVCLDFDGVKLSANVADALALVKSYLPLPETAAADGIDLAELLDKLLFTTFLTDNIKLSGDETSVQLLLKANDLLGAFGLSLGDIDLGDVYAWIGGGKVGVEALGATLELSAGEPFTVSTGGYPEITKFASAVIDIVKGGYLTADVAYTGYGLEVSGDLQLDIRSLKDVVAKGDFTVTYGKASKQLTVIYKGGDLYLDIDGLQLSANVKEAIGFVKGLLAKEEPTALENDALDSVLGKVFGLDFGALVTLEEGTDTLTLTLEGTELLNALGVEFALGQVQLVIGQNSIAVSALDATVTITAGDQFDAGDLTKYVDIVDYAEAVAALIKSGYLTADVAYTGYGLEVSGDLQLDIRNFKDIAAKGNFTVAYGKASKALTVIYKGGDLYLDIDGLGVSANAKEAIDLVKGLLAKEEPAALADDRLGAVLEKVFAFKFGDIVTVGEEGTTLNLTIKGTDLLTALGVEFALGQVELGITKDGVITASAYDVNITAQSCDAFTVEAPAYVDIVDYAEAVAALIKSGYISADVTYSGYGLEVTGTLLLDIRDFKNIVAKGDFTVAYGKASKQLSVIYKGGNLYLDIDGLQLSANAKEAIDLVKGLLAKEEPAALDNDTLDSVLEKVFAFKFGDIVTVGEEGTTLQLTVEGTDLLTALGVEFALGQVELGITKGGVITASAYDVNITAQSCNSFTVEAPAYVDIVDYAEAVATLIKSGYISADVAYTGYGLEVTGDLQLDIRNFKEIAAEGTFTLTYKGASKDITVAYAGGNVYLTLDGLKLSAGAKKAVEIVKSVLAAEEPAALADDQLDSILEKVFAFKFGDIVTVGEEGTTLNLTVEGTDLLTALGMEFALGQVKLGITKAGVVSVNAETLGATVTIQEGNAFAPATAGFTEVTPVLEKLPALLSAKAIDLEGNISVYIGGTHLSLDIGRGCFAWGLGAEKKDFSLFVDATLVAGRTSVGLQLTLTNTGVKAVIAGIGLEFAFDELKGLETSLLRVYEEIRLIVDGMLEEGSANPLPQLNSFKDILGALTASAAALEETAEETKGVDIAALINSLVIGASAKENGIAHLGYKPEGEEEELVSADILKELTEEGLVGILLGVTTENVTVSGELHVAVCTAAPEEQPAASVTVTAATVDALLGYIGSAIDLFQTTDLTLEFKDSAVTSSEEKYADSGYVKYKIDASMSTHRGEADLLHLDVNGKNLWVDADVYAHASINIAAQNAADSSLYIDLFILDAAPETDEGGNVTYAKKDNMLDFYVTLSQFGPASTTAEETPEYDPVRLYAPSDEILTLLSAALPVLGVDADVLNNYMIEKWLTLENVGQLKALGTLVQGLLGENITATVGKVGSLLNKAGELVGKLNSPGASEPAVAAMSVEPVTPFLVTDYLAGLTLSGKTLSVELDSEKLYGIPGLDNVVATLTKDADVEEEGGYTYGKFRTLALENIYDKTGTLNTTLHGTVGYDTVTPDVPKGTYQSFLGAEKLILALAKSATHIDGEVISGEETPHTYKLNNNFYIDGNIKINANLLIVKANIDIRLIALSVNIDENGKLGINIRLEYDGVYKLVTLINGNSTVDITIKDGLVYMKRVQTTQQGIRNDPIDPITIYRVAPLGSFTADILDHLAFILNFGSVVSNALGSATGSGSTSSTAAKVDFGKRLSDVLKAYTFTESADGATWDLTLNGDALVKGVLGDLNVTITQDKDGYIRDITADTKVVSIITAKVELHWRNPGGTMEEGVTDKTHDITSAEEDDITDENSGFGGMVQKLLGEGWGTEDYAGFVTFLEGSRKTVTFKHGGAAENLGEQNIIASTGADSLAERTLYSTLVYPDVSAPQYAPSDGLNVMGWAEVAPGEVLPADYVIWTKEHGHPVEVTFRAQTALGNNWKYDEAEDNYFYKAEMWYGAKIVFGDRTETVTDDNTAFNVWEYDVPAFAYGNREGHWQQNPEIASDGATFVAEYDPDRITYKSEVAFTVRGVAKNAYELVVDYGTDHTVYEPTAKGYTFLGWYEKGEDGSWTKVETGRVYQLGAEHRETTLEALWVSNLTVTLTKAERSHEKVEGGVDLWGTHVGGTTYYDYAMEAVITGGVIVGAPASAVTFELTYRFDAYKDGIGGGTETFGENTVEEYPSEGFIEGSATHVQSRETARAHVQIKYTMNGADLYDTGDVVASGEWVTVQS